MSARTFRSERARATCRAGRRSSGRVRKVGAAAGGLLATALTLSVMAVPAAGASPFVVNSLADDGDFTCDATCTLRDAVENANDTAGPDVVTFAPGLTGQINLTQAPGGDLDIRHAGLEIRGPGADKLSVVAAPDRRVFTLFGFDDPAQVVSMSGLTLTGGDPESDIGCFGDDGGAIAVEVACDGPGFAPQLDLTDMAIVSNHADGSGGGISAYNYYGIGGPAGKAATGSGSVNILRSTVSNNSAGEDGGGIDCCSGPQLNVVDSTIAKNEAGGYGGGIDVYAGNCSPPDAADRFVTQRCWEPTTLNNSTISANHATGFGGGVYSFDPDVDLSSTIVADNTADGDVPVSEKATASSELDSEPGVAFTAGRSLVETTTTGATIVSDPAASNIFGQDPQLGTLQNNGGPTPTELPAKTSPAIDTGIANSLATDQRGLARTVDRPPANAADGTDIGAVEIPADPPVEQPAPGPDPEPTPIPVRCRVRCRSSASASR